MRPQAFEQAPEERLASRQAPCPLSVGLGHQPVVSLVAPWTVSRAIAHRHGLLPCQLGKSYSERSRMIHAARAVILAALDRANIICRGTRNRQAPPESAPSTIS